MNGSIVPWLIAGAIAAGVALFGAGFAAGHHWAATSADAERQAAAVAALEHEAAAVAKAQATSERIWAIGLTLVTDIAVTRTRQRTIIEEVTRDVDAHPDLAGTLVPAATQRLRDEQADTSRRIAEGHPVQ